MLVHLGLRHSIDGQIRGAEVYPDVPRAKSSIWQAPLYENPTGTEVSAHA